MSITFETNPPSTDQANPFTMTPPPSCDIVVEPGLDPRPSTTSAGPLPFCVGPKPCLTSGMLQGPSPVTQSIAQEIDSIVAREQAFCRDFKCCGSQLADLFELLDHFEECHVGEDGQVIISPCLLPVASNAEENDNRVHEDQNCHDAEHTFELPDIRSCERLPPAIKSGSVADDDDLLQRRNQEAGGRSSNQQQRAPSPRRPTHLLSPPSRSTANQSPSNASAPASPPLTPPIEQAPPADGPSLLENSILSSPPSATSPAYPMLPNSPATAGVMFTSASHHKGDRTPPPSLAELTGVLSPEPSPGRSTSMQPTTIDPPCAPSPEALRIALSIAQEWCSAHATETDPFAFLSTTGLASPPPTSLVRSPNVNGQSCTALTAVPPSPVSPMAMHVDPSTPCPRYLRGWTGAGTTAASHKRTRAAALARVGRAAPDSDLDLSESDMSDMDSKVSAEKESKGAGNASSANETIRYHPCTVEGCVRGYQTWSGLRTHLASVHGIVLASHPPTKSSLSSSTSTSRCSTPANSEPPTSITLQCPVAACPRSYASKSGLKYHILSSHQGLVQAASSCSGTSPAVTVATNTKVPVGATRRKRKTRRVSDSPPLSSPTHSQEAKFAPAPMSVKAPKKDVPSRRSLRQASRDSDLRRGA